MIEGHRVSNQARRGYFETNGGANVGNRPIIGLANVSPTNGIVPAAVVGHGLGPITSKGILVVQTGQEHMI